MVKVGDKFEIGEFEWEIIEETERGFKLQSDDKFTGLFKETFFEIMYDITKSKLNEAEKRADVAEGKWEELKALLDEEISYNATSLRALFAQQWLVEMQNLERGENDEKS